MNPAKIAAWNRILFQAFAQKAEACDLTARFEEVLQWASVAGWFASRKGWFGWLNSRELEAELLRAAQTLPMPVGPRGTLSRPRWLHVLTEAYGTLGHTNLCRRWIQYDRDVAHDVILLNQKGVAPGNLVVMAKEAGGECVVLNGASPLLERAAELRAYAWQNADVVVLHTHPEEVIATVAFGVPGGPPVLLVNHADHSFWVGSAVADLVLDIRTSGHLWTRQARGVERTVILPLPLVKSDQIGTEGTTVLERKQKLRAKLRIPEEMTVFLTVGSAAKYEPVPGLDFVETAREILRRCPTACLIAIGPEDEGAWKAARLATGGRLRAWGRQPDSTLFCQSADVYLEGFPAGSLTALLEAGETGLACVRSPRACIPPYASDGVGLDEVEQPTDVEDYVRRAVGLAQDANARAELGKRLQQVIRSQHCGERWLARLREVKAQIPGAHSVCPDLQPTPVEEHRRDWVIQYLHRNDREVTKSTIVAEAFIEAWKRTTGEPQIDKALWAELEACETDVYHDGSTEAGQGVSTPLPGATHGAVRTPHPTQGVLRDFQQRAALWRLNQRIRRQGLRERLMADAGLAFASGRQDLARQLTYACLLRRISSLGDLAWIKMLIKTHLSPKWLVGLRRIIKGTA